MPQFERRLYEPADEDDVLDGEEDRLDDEGSRLPLLIVIALVVLASFGGVVWLAYTQGVERGRADAPRIVAEQQKRPVAPGKNPYSDLQIYRSKNADDDSAGPAPKSTPPAAAQSHPPQASPQRPVLTKQVATTTAPVTKPSVEKPVPSPAPAAESQPGANTSAAKAQPPPVSGKAAGMPRAIAPAITQSPQHPAANETKPQPSTRAATAKTGTVSQPAATTGAGYVLQIGSYKSQAEANASWQSYRQAHASVAAYGSDIRPADLGAKGTWYRLRIGPFATLAEASAACARLKASGANCFPAKR